MLRYLSDGFRTTGSQTFVLLVLWLYQFLWGFTLLMYVRSIIVPLMHRYPGDHLASSASRLFLAEGQFQLMKTDISHSYLWMLLGFAVVRLLLTPLLNAGIYFSIHHPQMNAGYRFIEGIRRLGRSFLGLYLIQVVLILAPVYWLYPIGKEALSSSVSYTELGTALLPWAVGYALYGYVIHLCFMYLLIGKATETSTSITMWLFIRKLPTILALAALLLALSGLVTAAALSVSLIWAGVSALLLQQLFHVAKLLFRLWSISTQYHYFCENRS